MRFSWRPAAVLLLVAVALVWAWIASLHRAQKQAGKPIADLGMTMPLNQSGGGPAPAEAYEVYSALYQAPTQEGLAFAQDSETDIPQVNGNCLKPASAQEQEMAAAFVSANQQSHRWEQKFSVPQGYRVLPQSELDRALMCLATHQRDGEQCKDYKQMRYVRLLGVPGFNHAHTRALVSVIKSCGHLCGSGGIFAVEKTASTWQRSQTTDFTRDCSWMY
jgi:hypothetical protein